jgi:protein-tyrosine-phosphatase
MPTRVLFVCAVNAARSPMAEALLRSLGGGEFEVQSAGVRPRDKIHPLTTRVLGAIHLDVSTHMTKSIDRFKTEAFDYVITLCDEAREARASMTASLENIHWNITDPLKAGDSNEQVFRETLWEVRRRIELFVTVARQQARERPPRQ